MATEAFCQEDLDCMSKITNHWQFIFDQVDFPGLHKCELKMCIVNCHIHVHHCQPFLFLNEWLNSLSRLNIK